MVVKISDYKGWKICDTNGKGMLHKCFINHIRKCDKKCWQRTTLVVSKYSSQIYKNGFHSKPLSNWKRAMRSGATIPIVLAYSLLSIMRVTFVRRDGRNDKRTREADSFRGILLPIIGMRFLARP